MLLGQKLGLGPKTRFGLGPSIFFGPKKITIDLNWVGFFTQTTLITRPNPIYKFHNTFGLCYDDVAKFDWQKFLIQQMPFSRFLHVYEWMNLEKKKIKLESKYKLYVLDFDSIEYVNLIKLMNLVHKFDLNFAYLTHSFWPTYQNMNLESKF